MITKAHGSVRSSCRLPMQLAGAQAARRMSAPAHTAPTASAAIWASDMFLRSEAYINRAWRGRLIRLRVDGRLYLPPMRTLLACFMIALAPAALAQGDYPNRPIRLIVTVPPGGAADFIARLVGAKLSEALAQPVLVENRGGAGGTIAAEAVAKAPADGYTLLQNSITTHGVGPHLYTKLPYDPVKDFASVSGLALLPLIMAVNADLPPRNVEELIRFSKANNLNFASSGNGGAPHMAAELFKSVTGASITHVPYKGSGPAVADLVGGRVKIMLDAAPSLLQHVRDWKRTS